MLIEGIPLLLIVGVLTNVPSIGWHKALLGVALLLALVIVSRFVWPAIPGDLGEAAIAADEAPRDTKSDKVALFITIGITMMVATWIALRLAK